MTSLEQLLDLVGELDDAEGSKTPRERFRNFLQRSLTTPAELRDFVESCVRNSGPQFNRALQDLVNHAAGMIGFKVEYGRYAGVRGQVGFDGLWQYGDLSIVAEVKTTDAYTIKTATLLSYVNDLISDHRIKSEEHALGLYVVARPDAELRQIENSIMAEKRMHRLRVATVDNILSIAELVQANFLTVKEAVDLIKPSGVSIDATVGLIARVASTAAQQATPLSEADVSPQKAPAAESTTSPALYLMTPVRDGEEETGEQIIRKLLEDGWYVFGEATPHRGHLKVGDHLCFYWSTVGVVAEAEVASEPKKKRLPQVKDADRFPWAFKVKNVRFFFDKPVLVDPSVRARLSVFKDRDPAGPWAWLVQSTRRLSEGDFRVLTGKPVD